MGDKFSKKYCKILFYLILLYLRSLQNCTQLESELLQNKRKIKSHKMVKRKLPIVSKGCHILNRKKDY